MWILCFAVFFSSVVLLLLSEPTEARAFKIGYRGIPIVVKDFPPVHEAVTAEAVRHFCNSEGLAALQESLLYRALFKHSVVSCDALAFGTDMADWRSQIESSPVGDLLLGARYPDLREMAGVDADSQDVDSQK